MRHNDYRDMRNDHDPRPSTAKAIWGMGIAALALSIPLTAIVGAWAHEFALYIPLAIIAGIAVSLMVVWFTPVGRNHSREIAELQQQIAELDERLTNLETIDSFEQRMAERHAARSMAQPPPIPQDPLASPEVPPRTGQTGMG